jgi:hypothetical protein
VRFIGDEAYNLLGWADPGGQIILEHLGCEKEHALPSPQLGTPLARDFPRECRREIVGIKPHDVVASVELLVHQRFRGCHEHELARWIPV